MVLTIHSKRTCRSPELRWKLATPQLDLHCRVAEARRLKQCLRAEIVWLQHYFVQRSWRCSTNLFLLVGATFHTR